MTLYKLQTESAIGSNDYYARWTGKVAEEVKYFGDEAHTEIRTGYLIHIFQNALN